jgi:hypothetical protein
VDSEFLLFNWKKLRVVGASRWFRIGIAVASGLAAVGGAGWLGLLVQPAPFPAYPDHSADRGTAAPSESLPAPVRLFAQVAEGDHVPITESAVISGRGRLTFSGITFPTRFRFIESGGRDYRHYIECTWFGFPFLKVNEWYLDGHLRQQLPFGVVANEPRADEAANLALWGEMVWLPSILLGDPRLRWEAVDEQTARLVVPPNQDESFTVAFSQTTGLLQSLTAMRYKTPQAQSKTPWRIDICGWECFRGVRVPSPVEIMWLDDGKPWFVMKLEDIVYNVDVSRSLTTSGP